MALLTLAVGLSGFIYSGEQSAMIDIANNFAGTIMGIINALGKNLGINLRLGIKSFQNI